MNDLGILNIALDYGLHLVIGIGWLIARITRMETRICHMDEDVKENRRLLNKVMLNLKLPG